MGDELVDEAIASAVEATGMTEEEMGEALIDLNQEEVAAVPDIAAEDALVEEVVDAGVVVDMEEEVKVDPDEIVAVPDKFLETNDGDIAVVDEGAAAAAAAAALPEDVMN